MDELTPEQIAQHYSAAMDSVNLLNAGKPEGIDEPDEANINTTTGLPHYDDTLPKAVRITIVASDPLQTLDPVMLSTTVWLSTAK